MGDNISTVGDNISTVEGIQYCGGLPSVLWGIASVLWGIPSILWRLFSTVGITSVQWGYHQYCGGIQYSGGRILISACLVINNDEKISTFFCIMIRNFHSEVF